MNLLCLCPCLAQPWVCSAGLWKTLCITFQAHSWCHLIFKMLTCLSGASTWHTTFHFVKLGLSIMLVFLARVLTLGPRLNICTAAILRRSIVLILYPYTRQDIQGFWAIQGHCSYSRSEDIDRPISNPWFHTSEYTGGRRRPASYQVLPASTTLCNPGSLLWAPRRSPRARPLGTMSFEGHWGMSSWTSVAPPARCLSNPPRGSSRVRWTARGCSGEWRTCCRWCQRTGRCWACEMGGRTGRTPVRWEQACWGCRWWSEWSSNGQRCRRAGSSSWWLAGRRCSGKTGVGERQGREEATRRGHGQTAQNYRHLIGSQLPAWRPAGGALRGTDCSKKGGEGRGRWEPKALQLCTRRALR